MKATLLSTLLVAALAFGQDEGKSLKGLRGIDVVVAPLPAVATTVGLDTRVLQADIESRLRESGINIVHAVNLPSLFAQISFVRSTLGNVAYQVSLSLRQPATLARDHSISTVATTWSGARIGIGEQNVVARSIRDDARDLVDTYLKAFFSVNPFPAK